MSTSSKHNRGRQSERFTGDSNQLLAIAHSRADRLLATQDDFAETVRELFESFPCDLTFSEIARSVLTDRLETKEQIDFGRLVIITAVQKVFAQDDPIVMQIRENGKNRRFGNILNASKPDAVRKSLDSRGTPSWEPDDAQLLVLMKTCVYPAGHPRAGSPMYADIAMIINRDNYDGRRVRDARSCCNRAYTLRKRSRETQSMEGDTGGDGDVEGVFLSEHGNVNVIRAALQDGGRNTEDLVTNHQEDAIVRHVG